MEPARRTACSESSVEPGRAGARRLGHAVQVGSGSVRRRKAVQTPGMTWSIGPSATWHRRACRRGHPVWLASGTAPDTQRGRYDHGVGAARALGLGQVIRVPPSRTGRGIVESGYFEGRWPQRQPTFQQPR